MSALRDATRLLDRFALPLLTGQTAHVGAPLGSATLDQLPSALTAGLSQTPAAEQLQAARHRQLQRWGGPDPIESLDDDPLALRLLGALHDLLFLLHPEALRLRADRRRALAQATLAQLQSTALDDDLDDPSGTVQRLYGRHSLLAPLERLSRHDLRRQLGGRTELYRGTQPPRRWLPLEKPQDEQLAVRLLDELPEAGDGLGRELCQALFDASPLTELLLPQLDLDADRLLDRAHWLRFPSVARIVSQRYLELGLAAIAPLLAAALCRRLTTLAQSAAPPSPAERRPLELWLCFASHLQLSSHVLGHSPLPPPSAPKPLLDLYGLYAALATTRPDLTRPADLASDERLGAAVAHHVAACGRLVAPSRLAELRDLCAQALSARGKIGAA